MNDFVGRHNSTRHTTIKRCFCFEKLKIPILIKEIECMGGKKVILAKI